MHPTSTGVSSMQNFGSRLREEREKLHLSQTELANQLGIHRNTQARYESGQREPDAGYLEAVRAAGVDVEYVINGSVGSRKRYSLGDRSPDPDLLAQVIAGVETAATTLGVVLSSDKKARTVVMLYRAFSASGSIDSKTIEQAISLAAS